MKRKKRIKVPKKYESLGGDEFARFDKLVTGVMQVPYSELQRRMEADERVTARKRPARSGPRNLPANAPLLAILKRTPETPRTEW